MDERLNLDTQAKLAKAADVSQSTINRILTLDQAATVDVLEKLARAFHLHPADLLMDGAVNIELMRQIGKLSSEEKDRVIGYIELASGSYVRQNSATQLEFESRSQVPERLRDVERSASRRQPGADRELTTSKHEKQQTSINTARKRRKT